MARNRISLDEHVGRRIRERRTLLGITQQELAAALGVTYQQAHKYERGINRLSADRLYKLSCVLGIPVTFFFEGFENGDTPQLSEGQRMRLEFARNFARIQDERSREALAQLCRIIADNQKIDNTDASARLT